MTAEYTHGYTPIDGIGSMVAASVSGTAQYPLYDHRGSVFRLTDSAGSVSAYYEYDAWGGVLREDASGVSNRFRWQSNWDLLGDSDGRFYGSLLRLYDARTGRFLNRNPWGFVQGRWSLYDVMKGNPVAYVEPFSVGEGAWATEAEYNYARLSPNERARLRRAREAAIGRGRGLQPPGVPIPPSRYTRPEPRYFDEESPDYHAMPEEKRACLAVNWKEWPRDLGSAVIDYLVSDGKNAARLRRYWEENCRCVYPTYEKWRDRITGPRRIITDEQFGEDVVYGGVYAGVGKSWFQREYEIHYGKRGQKDFFGARWIYEIPYHIFKLAMAAFSGGVLLLDWLELALWVPSTMGNEKMGQAKAQYRPIVSPVSEREVIMMELRDALEHGLRMEPRSAEALEGLIMTGDIEVK